MEKKLTESNNLKELIVNNPRAKIRVSIKRAEKKVREIDKKQKDDNYRQGLWRI